ncbi:MAG: efflux RND transporter periplasmic adaptor subunit [bacterium]|nr:efflux RND transporter periplasmic adaptor subunit [bacterium]
MRDRTRTGIPGLAALAVMAALGAGGCSRSGGADAGSAARRGGGPVPVAVVEAAPHDLARSVTVTGPLEPLRLVAVNAQSAGILESVLVEEGDRVTAGQLLAQIDAREMSAQLARAEAVLANAETAFRRAESLQAGDLVAESELDALRSSYGIARADVELWRTRVAFSRITAPAAGVVTAKRVERGSAVATNTALFTIADDAVMVVRVQVSEMDVVHLREGNAAAVSLDAYPKVQLEGRIRRIFPGADPVSRLVPVEVALGNVPAGVDARPGFLARVAFDLEARLGVLAVPVTAVGVGDGGSYLYLVQADTVARRPVTTGLTTDGWIEVTGGLEAGTRVISSGHVNLRPGAQVRISGSGAGSPR